MHSFKIYS